MFRNSYQRGMLTVFYSAGSNPFKIWETYTKNGYISRMLDEDIRSMVCDIRGTNVSTTYLTCPKGKATLGISMPFLIMVVKNLKKYFSFEVTILDETKTRRRFRVSNFQSTTQILPLCTVMPIGLSDGWNQIQFNLAEFTRRAYKKQFVEVQKLKINANIRLRRIYFAERLIPEDELPAEYKLYFPLTGKRVSPKRYDKPKEEGPKPVDQTPAEKKTSVEVIKAASTQKMSTVPENEEQMTERSLSTATPVFEAEIPAQNAEEPTGETEGKESEEKGVQVDTIGVPVNDEQVNEENETVVEGGTTNEPENQEQTAPSDVPAAEPAAEPATEETAPAEPEIKGEVKAEEN